MRAVITLQVPRIDDRVFASNAELRDAFIEMGLRPDDMPPVAEGISAEEMLKQYFQKRAQPIIDRMPDKIPEERERKDFAREHVFFASELAKSGTQFMVVRHTDGSARLRLVNPRIEELQAGCRILIESLDEHNRKAKITRIIPETDIKVFEHGLEEATIGGTIVSGIRRRWSYVQEHAGLEMMLVAVTLVLWFISIVVLASQLLRDNAEMKGHVERFSTAMFASAVVAAISVSNAVRTTPTIVWSVSYEEVN